MQTISINIPDAVIFDTKMTHESAETYARKAVALSYYTKSGISLGYCAEIAGLTKRDFISYLSENGISVFRYDDESEFLEELENA